MPAVTMVAACMRAETGVGPAMASGSHTWRGNWADLPIAPKNNSSPPTSATSSRVPPPTMLLVPTAALMVEKRKLPNEGAMRMVPRIRPTSATLLVRNALTAASLFSFFSQ